MRKVAHNKEATSEARPKDHEKNYCINIPEFIRGRSFAHTFEEQFRPLAFTCTNSRGQKGNKHFTEIRDIPRNEKERTVRIIKLAHDGKQGCITRMDTSVHW